MAHPAAGDHHTVPLVAKRNQWRFNQKWAFLFTLEEAQAYAALIDEADEDFLAVAKSTTLRRVRVINRFTEMIAQCACWAAFIGREFDYDRLYERMSAFLSFAVLVSESLLHEGRKMTYSSLRTVMYDLWAVVKENTPEIRIDLILQQEWHENLLHHIKHLAATNNLPLEPAPKIYMGVDDVKFLAETALLLRNNLSNTLQGILLLYQMLYTAGRVGSYIATQAYPEHFSKWKNVRLIRTEDGFMVEWTVDCWKGCHTEDVWRVTFRMSAVREKQHLLGDIPSLIICLGLREGLFAEHKNLDSLLSGRERHVKFREDILELPVFCASTPKGLALNHKSPMRYPAHRNFLTKLCHAAGFPVFSNRLSSLRRGGATKLQQVNGTLIAQNVMNHQQFSETIKHYSAAVTQTDVVGAITMGENRTVTGTSAADAPSLHRRNVRLRQDQLPSLSFEQALLRDPNLQRLHIQRQVLWAYVNTGDWPDTDSEEEDIKKVMATLLPEDVEHVARHGDNGVMDVLALFGHLSRRCKKQLANVRKRYDDEREKYITARAPPLTIDDFVARVARNNEHLVVADLLRGLVRTSKEVDGEDGEDGEEGEYRTVVTCQQEPEDPERGATDSASLNEARVDMMRSLVDYEEPENGPQTCPVCEDNEDLELEKRFKVYRTWFKVKMHMQAVHTSEEISRYFHDESTLSARVGALGGLGLLNPSLSLAMGDALF